MTATIISQIEHQARTGYVCHSVREAAEKLGVSSATIRRQIKALGVHRVAGDVVTGFVSWANAHGGTMDVRLPYAE